MIVTLDHTEDIAANITSFWFKPERPLRYDAGQFIELTIAHEHADDRGIKRWFTLSSSPTDELLSITTKRAPSPSSYKRQLFAMKPGDTALMSDAMGDFVLPKAKSTPLIFVAGGIGVTPAHSMTKWLHDKQEDRQIHLIYTAHSDTELAFKPLFDSYATVTDYIVNEAGPDFQNRTGALTVEDIYDAINSYDNPLTYLSGPEEMVEILFDELKQKGVNASRLVTDYFHGYAGSI